MESKKSNLEITRRDFIKSSSVAGAGILLSNSILGKTNLFTNERKKYAIVGIGGRSKMYRSAILEQYPNDSELVGFCDVNLGRMKLAQEEALKISGKKIPIYDAKDFDLMITEGKPDTVIVTTIDGFHHKYIIRSMELGCNVITEKPMTIDSEKCQQIIDTQKKTGKKCTVTFNYRYSPPRTQVKDILMSGEIGDILSVDFHWMLNTHHGADYFRRWHSNKNISGGLMVHKATHHFDLVNWWLSAIPVTVYALGKREYYTPEMAKRIGLKSHHQRCRTCPEKNQCGFELDLEKNESLKRLYLDNEQYDGYYRDQCVFRPEINIEDTMNVIAKYDNNVTLCYSLNAFNSWEGYNVIFNGTKGRLEHTIQEKIYLSGTDTEQGGIKEGGTKTRVFPLRGPAFDVEPWSGTGGHGGGDRVLLDDLFASKKTLDKYLRAADYRSGAYSILIGAAANLSFKMGKEITISELVKNIGYPDYPLMPKKSEQLPMPVKT